MAIRRVFPIVVCLALALCGGADAGTLQEDFPTLGTFHWGPFRARPYFMMKNLGYDSNVFLQDGTATSDFTATAEVGLRLFSLFRNRGALQVEEILDYVWYEQNGELTHFNNVFQAKGAYYMRRGRAFAELRLLSLEERPTSEIDYQIRRRERSLGAGWEFVWPHSSLRFRMGRDSFDYEAGNEAGENIPPALNRLEKSVTVTGSKRILPKTDLLLEWEGKRIDFIEPAGEPSDSRSRRISTGFLFDASAFIKGSIKVGWQDLEPDNDQLQGFAGIVGDGALVYRFTGHTALEIRGRRQTGFTTAFANIYYIDNGYGATLTQALGDRVAGEVGIDRGRIDFPVPTLAFDEEDDVLVSGHRVDEIRAYFAGASYRFSPLTRFGLRLGVWERNSTFEFLNRHRFTVQMIYAYNF
jgi:hypothetical protein